MAHMHLHAGTGKLANIARRLKVGAGNDIAALVKDEAMPLMPAPPIPIKWALLKSGAEVAVWESACARVLLA